MEFCFSWGQHPLWPIRGCAVFSPQLLIVPCHTCLQPSFRIVPAVGWCCRDFGCLRVLAQESVPSSHLRKSLILQRELTEPGSICGGHIVTVIQVWCDHASHHWSCWKWAVVKWWVQITSLVPAKDEKWKCTDIFSPKYIYIFFL